MSSDLVEEVVGGVAVRCYRNRTTSLVDLLEQALPASADDVLLVDPELGRTVTYAQFAALVEGAAVTLLERGCCPGDRVGVLVRNGLEAAVAIWACARAGLVHVGLPVRRSGGADGRAGRAHLAGARAGPAGSR